MDGSNLDNAIDLIGALALLWTGVTLVRIAKRFSIAEVPAPFNIDMAEFKKKRRWRDGASLVVAGVGIGLIVAATVRLFIV